MGGVIDGEEVETNPVPARGGKGEGVGGILGEDAGGEVERRRDVGGGGGGGSDLVFGGEVGGGLRVGEELATVKAGSKSCSATVKEEVIRRFEGWGWWLTEDGGEKEGEEKE